MRWKERICWSPTVSRTFKRWHLHFLLQDAKKSVWVPDGEGGYDEAMIDNIDGEKVNFITFWFSTLTFFLKANVRVGWEEKTFKANQLMQVNPPKMEKFEDVSNMTYLNEASVLWNLKSRYVCKLIYVSFVLGKHKATSLPNI